jgi:hypothetical protein
MPTQYRLVQSGKNASGGCSAGQGSSEPVAPRIYLLYNLLQYLVFLEILDNGQSPKTLFFQVQYAIVRILQN